MSVSRLLVPLAILVCKATLQEGVSVGHPRKAGSEGYFKKLSKPLFHWDHRHPLGPKQLLFYDFLKKCAAGAL